jgi:hypothetical protein
LNLAGDDQPPGYSVVDVVLSCVFLGCKTDTGLAASLFSVIDAAYAAPLSTGDPSSFPVKAMSELLAYALGTQ